MPEIVGVLSPNFERLFDHRLREVLFCCFSWLEKHVGGFSSSFTLLVWAQSEVKYAWILITEDPFHTLSSGSFKLFLITQDHASSNFFLILHWVTLDKDIGIRLNKKKNLFVFHMKDCVLSIF